MHFILLQFLNLFKILCCGIGQIPLAIISGGIACVRLQSRFRVGGPCFADEPQGETDLAGILGCGFLKDEF
jgi:hypothetical protein